MTWADRSLHKHTTRDPERLVCLFFPSAKLCSTLPPCHAESKTLVLSKESRRTRMVTQNPTPLLSKPSVCSQHRGLTLPVKYGSRLTCELRATEGEGKGGENIPKSVVPLLPISCRKDFRGVKRSGTASACFTVQ